MKTLLIATLLTLGLSTTIAKADTWYPTVIHCYNAWTHVCVEEPSLVNRYYVHRHVGRYHRVRKHWWDWYW